MTTPEIDWRSVAARIVLKVDDCCGCNCFEPLTPEEGAALDVAVEEARP